MAVSRRWVYVRKCADNFHLHQCWYYYNNLLANYVETSSIYCTLLLSYENVEYKICNQLPATHTHTHTHLLLHNTIIFICTYKIMVFFACFREVNRMCVCRLSTGSRTVIRKTKSHAHCRRRSSSVNQKLTRYIKFRDYTKHIRPFCVYGSLNIRARVLILICICVGVRVCA